MNKIIYDNGDIQQSMGTHGQDMEPYYQGVHLSSKGNLIDGSDSYGNQKFSEVASAYLRESSGRDESRPSDVPLEYEDLQHIPD